MASIFSKLALVCLLFSIRSYSQQSINKEYVITIGDIKQYILIKGKDDSKPILLFLHGGPGASLMGKVDKISGKLQEEFVVVQLSQVKIPFENANQLYYHRKWLFKHEGQKFVSINLRKSIVEAWARTWFKVWSKSCDVNLFQSLPSINCPVYFFAGKLDYNTNATITSEYAEKVRAPKKALIVIPDAGHGCQKRIRPNSRK